MVNVAFKTRLAREGISQRAIATATGIRESRLSNIAQGLSIPSRSEAEMIAKILNAQVEDLFDRVREPSKLQATIDARRMNIHDLHLATRISTWRLRSIIYRNAVPSDAEKAAISKAIGLGDLFDETEPATAAEASC